MPTSDQVVVRLERGSTEPGPDRPLILYDDGSLVDSDSWPPTVRALTLAGRELVVGRVHDTGSFTKSHTIPAIPVASGFGFFEVTLVVDGAPISVGFSNVTCEAAGSPAGCKDNPETPALLALVDALSDVASWLPASAFRDGDTRPHPYLAAKSRVTSEWIQLRPEDWTNPEQSLRNFDWLLDTQPTELGSPIDLPGQPERALRCGLIDGTQERALRATLMPYASDSLVSDPRTTMWDVWTGGGPELLRLTLRPYLPDEVGGCTTPLPAAPTLAGAPRPSLAAVLVASKGGIGPSQPGSDLLVWIHRVADGTRIAQVAYFADGTVLFGDPSPPAIGIGALRLTPSGLAQLHQLLDDSGLLTAEYDESIPEGAAYEHSATILTPEVDLNVTDRGRDAKATAIMQLAAKLADPASWLPATAWTTDPARLLPFRPVSVRLWIEPTAAPTDRELPRATALEWPLGGSLQTIGQASADTPGARVATLSTQDATALALAIEATGARPSGGPTSVAYLLAADVPGGALSVSLGVDISQWGW